MNRRKFVRQICIIGLTSTVPWAKAITHTEKIRINCENYGRSSEITKLLSHLDLSRPDLRKVKILKGDPEQASRKLLCYYRSRHLVKNFIGPKPNHKVPGAATEKDMKMANDALDHVFIGQPSYPPHFVGKDIKWDTQPVADKEWVWQLNRMYFWNAMGKAYWATNNKKYARAWCTQLIDWIEKNPRDGHHQYAWRSIEAGIRGHSWTELFRRFLDAPSFTPKVLVTFLNNVYDHATYLMTQYSKDSNWGLIEAEGLAFIAIIFPEFKDSIKWRREAVRRFKNEIKSQVYADGFQRELSMNYHMGSIRWFLRTYELAKMNGLQAVFPTSYLSRIEKMCEVPMKLGLPDGTTAQFGDSWVGKPGQYQDKFMKWAKLFGRTDFLYLATNGKKGTIPNAKAYALKKSGFYSMRSSWDRDAICMVLKCGSDGGYHCQPDNGTFSLYAGGRHLMPDSGSYIYSGDPEGRSWFRQTKVHQTLTLDGKNSDYAPELLLWKPGEDLDKLVVENQSYANLKHRRAVLFVEKKYFVIIDEAMGEALGNIDIHFQLAPGNALFNKKHLSVRSDFMDGWNVFIQTNNQQNIQLEKERGQVSFKYHEKEPRPAFRYRIHKKNSQGVRFVTVVIPYQEKTPPEVRARIIGEPEIGATCINVEIAADGISKRIKYKL